MSSVTRERHEAIQNDAMRLVTAIDVATLDAMDPDAANSVKVGFAKQLVAQHSIGYEAAKNHVVKACRRQRHPDWEPAVGWGGDRRSEEFREGGE